MQIDSKGMTSSAKVSTPQYTETYRTGNMLLGAKPTLRLKPAKLGRERYGHPPPINVENRNHLDYDQRSRRKNQAAAYELNSQSFLNHVAQTVINAVQPSQIKIGCSSIAFRQNESGV